MADVPRHLAEAGVTHKDCKACGEYKHYDEFCKDRRRVDGAHRDCNECKKAAIAPMRERYSGYGPTYRAKKPWMQMIANARGRARAEGWDFDLDDYKDELKARVQPLVCEISGVALVAGSSRGPYSPSFDRIDSSKGYVYSNVRVIAWALNRLFADWGEDAVKDIVISWINKNG